MQTTDPHKVSTLIELAKDFHAAAERDLARGDLRAWAASLRLAGEFATEATEGLL